INLIKKSNNIEFINFKSINDDYHIHNKIIKEKPSNRIKIIKYFAFQNINQDTLFICKKILDTIKNYKNKKIGILVSDNKTFEILKSNLEAFNINFHIAENRNKSTFIAFFISFLSLIFEFEISIFFSVLRNILNFFYFKKSSYKSQNFYFQIFQFEELAKQKFLFNQEDIIKELKLQNNKKFYFIRHFLKWINKIKRAQNIKTLLDMMFIFLNKVEKLNDSESLNINYNKQLQTQKLKILQLCSIILNAKISNIKTEIAVLKYLLHNIKTPSYNNSIKNLNNIEVNIFNSIKSLYMYDCDLIFLANLQYDIFKKEQYNSFLPPHIIKDLSLDLQEQENLYYFAQVFKKNIFITIQEDIAKNIHKISSLKFDIKSIINCEVIFKATTKNIIYDISQNIKNIFINENLHSQDSYNQVLNYNINHYIVYATHIEQYIKDKFAFYAEKILKLKINNEIKSIPEANIFGSIMHELIRYYFIEIRAKFIEDNNFNIVNTLVEQYFNAKSEILKNIYLNKALEVLNMFILYIYPNIIYKTNFIEHKYKVEEYNKCYSKISIKSDSNISNTFIEYYEHKIEASFKIDQNEYTLLAILDFLRINNNQKYLLVDYKTGVLPTKKDITTFKHTQLLTSAIIIILSNYSKLEKIIFNPKCNNEEIIKKIWNKFHQENKEIQISYIKLSNKIKSIKEVSVIISYEIFIEYIEFLINILLQINNSDIASFKNQDHEKYSLLL
ncbi:MAG: PD-(D/E)XK nuclease family protein, partial [Rickettsiales bacterium]